jgi:hypothetical protein
MKEMSFALAAAILSGRRLASASRLGRPVVGAIGLRWQNDELAVAGEGLELDVEADAFGVWEGDADFG